MFFAHSLTREAPPREIRVFKAPDGEWVEAAMPIIRSQLVIAQRRYQGNLDVQYEYSSDLHLSPKQADQFAIEALRKHLTKETGK
jgi:hypothetical protein